jgi:hypothetical protein
VWRICLMQELLRHRNLERQATVELCLSERVFISRCGATIKAKINSLRSAARPLLCNDSTIERSLLYGRHGPQRIHFCAACCPATSNKHSCIYCCVYFEVAVFRQLPHGTNTPHYYNSPVLIFVATLLRC